MSNESRLPSETTQLAPITVNGAQLCAGTDARIVTDPHGPLDARRRIYASEASETYRGRIGGTRAPQLREAPPLKSAMMIDKVPRRN